MTMRRRTVLKGAQRSGRRRWCGGAGLRRRGLRAQARGLADLRNHHPHRGCQARGATRILGPGPRLHGGGLDPAAGRHLGRPGGTASVAQVGPYQARVLSVAWAQETARPAAVIRSRVATRNRAVDLSARGAAPALSAAERRLYTAPTTLLPTDGIVKETADKITAGANGDLDKARRIMNGS